MRKKLNKYMSVASFSLTIDSILFINPPHSKVRCPLNCGIKEFTIGVFK